MSLWPLAHWMIHKCHDPYIYIFYQNGKGWWHRDSNSGKVLAWENLLFILDLHLFIFLKRFSITIWLRLEIIIYQHGLSRFLGHEIDDCLTMREWSTFWWNGLHCFPKHFYRKNLLSGITSLMFWFASHEYMSEGVIIQVGVCQNTRTGRNTGVSAIKCAMPMGQCQRQYVVECRL